MVLGAVVGFLAAVWSLAGIRRARTRLSPRGVPRRFMAAGGSLRGAVEEGRRTMREYESEARLRWGVDAGSARGEVVRLRDVRAGTGTRNGSGPA